MFSSLSAPTVRHLERHAGNGDLIRALEALGIAGPFTVTSPWELADERGRHLISAGGYAALPFGEHYPPLTEFVKDYVQHNTAPGLPQQSASPWRAALETNLVALLARQAPSHHDSQVFFSNSGAEAIEAAIKFVRAARPRAKTLVNFSGAYHGKTAGALSLTPNEEYQAPFRPLLDNIVTLPYGDADVFVETIAELGADRVAGVILEPLLGEGGVVTPPPDFLPAVTKVCQKHGIVIVADEVQSGLGRTGHWFASVAGGLEPDIITLAKPLGGGLVPVGATIARRNIVRRALGGLYAKRHSNTFGGGSLAMAVGLKSLEILVDEDLVNRARTLGDHGLARLKAIQQKHPDFLAEVRGAGMLFALQLQPLLPDRILPSQAELVSQLGSGLGLRALHRAGVHACYTLNASRIIRLSPALNMPEHLFETLFDRVETAARRSPHTWQLVPKAPPKTLFGLARLALKR